jgi:hypothetical protein
MNQALTVGLDFPGDQDVTVAEYVRTCQTCQQTKAEHCCPRGLLHPLQLPSRRGGMIGVDWIAGLPTTAAGFDMIQNHINLLSGKVHAVPTRSTATAADAAAIIRYLCLCSGDGDRSRVRFSAPSSRAGARASSSARRTTRTPTLRWSKPTALCAFANGRKDDWDCHLPLTVFAINNATSTLGGDLTPFFVDRGAHQRLPLSPPRDDLAAG